MSWWTTDPDGWLLAESQDPVPGAVAEPPPAHAAEPLPGEHWPRWFRARWTLDLYPLPPVQPTACAIDADGWFAGEVPVGTPGSVRARPDVLSTTTNPGEPRARWVQGSWVTQAYTAPPRHITKRSFWNRFPPAHEAAMRLVMARGLPVLLCAGLLRLTARVEASPHVDLDLLDTQQGVGWVASLGVPEAVEIDGETLPIRLSAEAAAHILNSPITPAERP